jgi:hypothetical protein
VTGLKELNRALGKAEKETRKKVRARYGEVGEIVRQPATQLFSRYDAESAGGFKVRVRQRGVSVEQTKRRVTGARGDYGALQMTSALMPALESRSDRVIDEFERAVDDIADIIEHG